METIRLATPLGRIEVEHANKSITVSGSQVALAWWRSRVSEGLYGPHGHIFDPKDCDACDVYHAALEAVGIENVEASKSFVALSTSQTRKIPKDAIP